MEYAGRWQIYPASRLAPEAGRLLRNRLRDRGEVERRGISQGCVRIVRQHCSEQLINLSFVRRKACCRSDCGPSTEGACWLLTLQV